MRPAKAWLATAGIAVGVVATATSGRGTRPQRGDHDSRPPHALTHRASAAELATRNRVARAESAKLAARKRMTRRASPATTWVSLGPTDAPGVQLHRHLGRRLGAAEQHRRRSARRERRLHGGVGRRRVEVVRLPAATRRRGRRRSTTSPNLAVGALAIDPQHPDTLYVGNGDFVDALGRHDPEDTDGGATWSAPVVLAGTSAGGKPLTPLSVRTLGVNGDIVLAATDAGLFVSNDGGATFSLVHLLGPNKSSVPESVWSVLSTGGTSWVATGVSWCSDTVPPPIAAGTGIGSRCAAGNNGSIWRRPTTARRGRARRSRPRTSGARRSRSARPTRRRTRPSSTRSSASIDGFTTLGVLALDERRRDVGRRDRHAREPDRRRPVLRLRRPQRRSRSDLVQPGDRRRSDERRSRAGRRQPVRRAHAERHRGDADVGARVPLAAGRRLRRDRERRAAVRPRRLAHRLRRCRRAAA